MLPPVPPWRGGREFADRGVRHGQRGFPQEQARRKPLDRAAHDALGIAGLDLALDVDRQFVERAVGGEGVGDVAERVFMLIEPAIGRNVDAPACDVLAIMVARREAQNLDHAAGRRVVAIGGRMRNADMHAYPSSRGLLRLSTADHHLPIRSRFADERRPLRVL